MEDFPIEPHENDVLMGRGGLNNKHSGNEKLRQLARQYGSKYKTLTKKEKSDLSRYLVRRMRELDPPARFLKRVQQTAAWEEVGDDTAREKASQVLRDAVAGLLDKQTTDEPLPTVSAQTSTDVDDQHQPQHEYESPQSIARYDSDLHAASMPDEEVSSSSAAFNPVPYPPPHHYRHPSTPPSSTQQPLPPYQLHPSSHHHSQPPPPPPPLSLAETPPEQKRRRYSIEETLSFTTPPSVSQYSPIRRHHSANTYLVRRPPRVSRNRSTSTDEMGQLLAGELLESDSDDDPVIPPRSA